MVIVMVIETVIVSETVMATRLRDRWRMPDPEPGLPESPTSPENAIDWLRREIGDSGRPGSGMRQPLRHPIENV